uniref:Cell division cycle protein 23 n=1 Tax=Arundo donax TaxID=35708 RepID=A0A0A9DWJ6_ARUDO
MHFTTSRNHHTCNLMMLVSGLPWLSAMKVIHFK